MVWNKQRIVDELKKLYEAGKPLSYNAMTRKNQSLVSAAAYHFGSYSRAVTRSGIDYTAVTRRPRWSKATIIAQIKEAKRKGIDLHWSSVTQRRDELGKAAFASLQPRLFGKWERALASAGLDSEEVCRYRKWDQNSVVSELKELSSNGQELNSGALQAQDPGLHAAAVRHFGSYDTALRAAKLDPSQVRRRKSWTKEQVMTEIRQVARGGAKVSDLSIRNANAALYGAAVRLFGSFAKARAAAGVTPKPKKQ